jgi:hypothetical protein
MREAILVEGVVDCFRKIVLVVLERRWNILELNTCKYF